MTRRLTDGQRFLRDLGVLLGLPAVVLAGLVYWWSPWEAVKDYQSERSPSDLAAIRAGHRETRWHGLHIVVPQSYVLALDATPLEAIQVDAPLRGKATWPARLAFLPLTPDSRRRFEEAAGNCGLDPGRCWSDTLPRLIVRCHRSSGVPDPDLSWTPQIECQVPALSLRGAISAPSDNALELLRLFESAVVTARAPSGGAAAPVALAPRRSGRG